ncbi:MAG: ABC-2 type transport system permease protein, partial [Candidatus Azotimanducaceae bacterium]
AILDGIASLGFLSHFQAISKGVLSLSDVLYFLSVIVLWLGATMIVLEKKQAS